ncbi:hypothetical protein [Streptomyces genisteinicus]|uniref:Uncharacterized protein n=1 Tax=Streptomyces genisteinicus TaxID=2768068 RepID=A0A7H0I272_9ACTN|nr:hypothetical protein [Streptomyces genisteinicus]QNP66888.1 hypothetical protein IAG43_30840 [Streptomyces genisteinicus]
MSEEKTIAPAGGASWPAAIGCALAAVVGVPVLVLLGVLVTFTVQRSVPEDYPTVAPQAMADRVGARSQEAYAVLGLGGELPPGAANSFSSGVCYPDGLESAADEPAPGSYALSHSWELDGVPREEAVAGVERLRERLAGDGWRIAAHDGAPGEEGVELRAEHDDEGRQVYTWHPGGTFRGGVHGACAFDPAGEDRTDVSPGLYPPVLRPS